MENEYNEKGHARVAIRLYKFCRANLIKADYFAGRNEVLSIFAEVLDFIAEEYRRAEKKE